jgi:hypothetical protein
MGSSKTGSLDKFASFSPAAAFASGKVKLPETGLIGMMQQDQEDKMAMNAANIAAQQPSQQQNQYNQMLQQMMMNQQRPSPYSPAPYANGGNVTLRRKMFKLGGSASAHGTGLTSGLEFNQGGRVGMQAGGVPGFLLNLGLLGIPKALRFLKNKDVRKFGANQADEINKKIAEQMSKRGGKALTTKQLDAIYDAAKPLTAGQRFTQGATTLGIPGIYGAGLGTAGLERIDEEFGTNLFDKDRSGAERALSFTQYPLDYFSTAALGTTIGQGFFKDPEDFDEIKTISQLVSGRDSESTADDALAGGREIEDDISSSELAERIATQDAERMREAMEMYQELIRGEDNTNKLATLGDALIAGGSSLLEGEGYGAAASAFNQPLSQARVGQEAADAEARAAAAQLAIGEDISRRQADQELSMNLLAAGDLNTEEEIQAVLRARSVGISQRLPEDDKGEVDEAALRDRGVGVYVDPRQRYNKLFVSINSQGIPKGVIYTNDPEKAKQHAKS